MDSMRKSPNCVYVGDTIQYAGSVWTITSVHPHGVVLRNNTTGNTCVRRYQDCK